MSSESLRFADRLADRIRLHRQADERPIVVGEGGGDQRFIQRVLAADVVFFGAGSRSVVLETAIKATELGIDRIACVVDRDFDDDVAAAEHLSGAIVSYDHADLEAMLFWSPILDDVIAEIGSASKIEKFGGVGAVRTAAVDAVRPLQRLRRANAMHRWGLKFDDLDLRRRVKPQTLSVNLQSLCDSLWSPELGIAKGELYEVAMSGEEAYCPTTGQVLVRGRDVLAVVGVALRRAIGTVTHQNAHPERIAEVIRLGATPGSLAATTWLQRLKTRLKL